MVFLIAGQEQIAARDQVASIIRKEWGGRVEQNDVDLADDIVGGLYGHGFRVTQGDPPKPILTSDAARKALTEMLEGAVEDVLDWDTFKSATDEDIARRLVEFMMSDDCDYEVMVREKVE